MKKNNVKQQVFNGTSEELNRNMDFITDNNEMDFINYIALLHKKTI